MKKADLNTGVHTPVFLILSYYLFVALDILSTYLATRDLKYESNVIIRTLKLNWLEIIGLALIGTLLLSFIFIISRSFILNQFSRGNKNISFKFCLAVAGVWAFYSHYIYSLLIPVNNMLSFFYLQGEIDLIGRISKLFISIVKSIPFFYHYLQVFVIVLAFIITLLQIRQSRDRHF